MKTCPFAIHPDPARKLLTIRFDEVFWSMDVADRFMADCLAAAASLGCGPGEHRVLVDLRNAVLQSQGVVAKMQGLIGGATAARIALVASSPLARMQTKRLQLRENVILFAELPEAEGWLFENELAAA